MNNFNRFRYIIFGAGAIGSVLGGFLKLADKNVVIIGRQHHIASINKNGLQMNSYEKSWSVKISAFDTIKKIQPQKDDIVFLVVKSNDTASSVHELAKIFPNSTPVFSFQNSVDNEKIIASVFPHTYGGVVRMTSHLYLTGTVNFRKIGRLIVGKYPFGIDKIVQSVAYDLEEAGFDISVSENIMKDKWLKLALNATSVITAIFSSPAIDRNDTNRIKIKILQEIKNILQIAKIDATPCSEKYKSIEEMISHFHKPAQPYRPKIPVYNSTWQALANKKPLEAQYFLKIFLELAKQHNFAAPITKKVLEMCNYLERNKLSPEYYQPNDIKKLL